MYTKEELEGMKFRQLKSIAQQKNISRRLTTKREIIDSLLNFDQEENLDDITVTLINSSEVEESPPAKKSEVSVNLQSGKKNEPENVRKTRTARRRFPKPRMTLFQKYETEDQDQPLVTCTNQSSKGNVKYFDKLGSKKMNEVDEGLNTSSESLGTSDAYSAKKRESVIYLLDNYGEIQKSNKKQTRSSTRIISPKRSINLDYGIVNSSSASSRITRRRRKTNAGKERSETVASESQIAEKEYINLAVGKKRQVKYFKHSLSNMVEDAISTEAGAGKERSETVASEPQIAEKEYIDLATNARQQQASYLKNSLKNVMEDTINTEEVMTEADAEDMDPKLNETFEVEEQHSKMTNILNVRKSGRKNKMFPTELRRSVRRRRTIMLSPKDKMVFTPKDIQKESPKLNETFEIEEESDSTLDNHKCEEKCEMSSEIKRTVRSQDISSPQYCNKISLQKENEEIGTSNSNMETSLLETNENEASYTMLENKGNGNKRRSRSSPRETSNKNDFNLQFFSPSKSVTKSKDSQKKDTAMKGTRIPKFIKKMPDFQNIHKKQFEKMESLVDNHQRKLERAKGLLSPAMSKDAVMVFTAQPTIKQSPLRKPLAHNRDLRIPTKLNDRYNAHIVLKDHNAPIPAQNARNNMYNKQNIKELITRKLPIHDRRENVRQESRTTIRGVRLNRRFELQMAHRKIN